MYNPEYLYNQLCVIYDKTQGNPYPKSGLILIEFQSKNNYTSTDK